MFGVTVAGRPPEIAGIESMVGLFINTLPLRVQLPPGTALLELLRQVQDSQSRLMEHQHLGLAEVQGLAGLGELFDTLVVFENYPVDRAGLSSRSRRSAAHRLPRARCHPLSAQPGRASRRTAAAAAELSTRPVRSFERGGDSWAGWFGCWRERLPIRIVRSAGSTFSARESVTPSCGSGTTPRVRSLARPCLSCSRRRWRARRLRMRLCSRMSG